MQKAITVSKVVNKLKRVYKLKPKLSKRPRGPVRQAGGLPEYKQHNDMVTNTNEYFIQIHI